MTRQIYQSLPRRRGLNSHCSVVVGSAETRHPGRRSATAEPGNTWENRGGDQRNTVAIVNQTKRIAGLTCIVMRDKVSAAGKLNEATDDWYRQAKNGHNISLRE